MVIYEHMMIHVTKELHNCHCLWIVKGVSCELSKEKCF